jgi:hypothetical protein
VCVCACFHSLLCRHSLSPISPLSSLTSMGAPITVFFTLMSSLSAITSPLYTLSSHLSCSSLYPSFHSITHSRCPTTARERCARTTERSPCWGRGRCRSFTTSLATRLRGLSSSCTCCIHHPLSDHVSDHVSDHASDRASDHVSDHVSDHASDHASDPEDLLKSCTSSDATL